MKKYLLILFSLFSLALWGQSDSVLITKNFKFQDGVYLSFAAFQKNQPDYSWDEAEGRMVTNADTYVSKIEWLRVTNGETKRHLPFPKVWGVCIGGIPFIKTPVQYPDYVLFAALRVRGKLCYFSYEEEAIEQVVISAYNPLTGRPFRSGKVSNKVYHHQEKMIDFEQGTIVDFNPTNFLDLIKDDPKLSASVRDLSEEEAQEKLFKSLLIYVDRNPVYVLTDKTQ
ncbi:MAG: hypothetical protein DHS20C18_12370 [Saprospiraceae bacterium]|nr:MAG: hypothetical protein DHS20C18_12370 [Saprospiraceae bacterium]